ncbi:hypothetical protein, partial [Mesomycoplasma ovipneumoniae]
PNSLPELQQKIKQIQDEFENKIVKNFRDNGWDSSPQSFTRFSPSSPLFEKSLNSILHNPVENQAFFGTIIGQNPKNLNVSVEIPDSIFDLSQFLTQIQFSLTTPQPVADLAKDLLDKQESFGFKFLDFFKLLKGTQPSSSGQISS